MINHWHLIMDVHEPFVNQHRCVEIYIEAIEDCVGWEWSDVYDAVVCSDSHCWSDLLVHRLISPLEYLEDGGICEGFHCKFGSDGIQKY